MSTVTICWSTANPVAKRPGAASAPRPDTRRKPTHTARRTDQTRDRAEGRHPLGPVTGLVGAAGGVGGFLLVSGLGALADATGSFATGFAVLAVVAVLAAVAARSRDREWRRTSDLTGDMEVAV